MPPENNYQAILGDYSSIVSCLFDIREMEVEGKLAIYPTILQQLDVLQNDRLKKMFQVSRRVFRRLGGEDDTEVFNPEGDFSGIDFSGLDYSVSYPDIDDTSYSTRIQDIYKHLTYFKQHWEGLYAEEIYLLNGAWVPVLDTFDELQDELFHLGMNTAGCGKSEGFNNSGSLFMAAAGSDGSDGSSAGIHLRWGFTGDLGSHHLPKGDYHNLTGNTVGYNRASDHVQLYRTSYTGPVLTTLDLRQALPVINIALLRWTYVINRSVNGKPRTTRIRLTFEDPELYFLLATQVSAMDQPLELLNRYDGMLRVELYRQSAFSIGIGFSQTANVPPAKLKLEIYQRAADGSSGPMVIRRTLLPSSENIQYLPGDNMSRLRLRKEGGGQLETLVIETYADLAAVKNDSDWTLVDGQMALTTNDQQAYQRLENSRYSIDQQWPHYNESLKVHAQSYKDKWDGSDPGNAGSQSLKAIVTDFLSLSTTNPRAEKAFSGSFQDEGSQQINISYLDVLNLAAADFHIARMLGLGYIDTPSGGSLNDRYIYKARYVANRSQNDNHPVIHEYMTLPTAKLDQRLPVTPVMRPLRYDLPSSDSWSGSLVDEQGYGADGAGRVINIGRALYPEEIPVNFFYGQNEYADFNLSIESRPVFYGVEYRHNDDDLYVRPEVTAGAQDGPAYYAFDADHPSVLVREAVPVPDDPESLYIHLVSSGGIHRYALYGISLFSRPSAMSNEVSSDHTELIIPNNLTAPTDAAVQYIQREETLLFTTSTEQAWLAGRAGAFPDGDTALTRIQFNYVDIHDITYTELNEVIKADRVLVYFKADAPRELKGQVGNVRSLADQPELLEITVTSYEQFDGTMVGADLGIVNPTAFAGGNLVSPEGSFRVVSVNPGLGSLQIVIQRNRDTQLVEDTLGTNYGGATRYEAPGVGSKFFILENLGEPSNWEKLNAHIQLVDLTNASEPVLETEQNTMNTVRNWIGGLHGSAKIEPLIGIDEQWVPGCYTIEYTGGVTLPEHPQYALPYDPAQPTLHPPGINRQPHVEWYKGIVRTSLATGQEKKALEVLRIQQVSPNIKLMVYDPTYTESAIQVSLVAGDLVSGVNFHPGYKAYLYPEKAPNTFSRDSILPSPSENDKKTLIGLCTSTSNEEVHSPLSVPVILHARTVLQLQRPSLPTALTLKVRPDSTEKAAFSFDVEVLPDNDGQKRMPFGMAFYRTSHIDILHALYHDNTVSAILDAEQVVSDSTYLSLVEMDNDPTALGFPLPDRAGLTQPDDTQGQRMAKYEEAIRSTLLPLSEQVPVFKYIKEGQLTENTRPVIYDIDHKMLKPDDPAFNSFPMIRWFNSTEEPYLTTVRFTDYTLNATTRALYFYATAEVDLQLVPGPLSPFIGPVRVMHTKMPPVPVVRRIEIFTNAQNALGVSVEISLSAYAVQEAVSKFRVYRSAELSQAESFPITADFIDIAIEPGTVGGSMLIDELPEFGQEYLGKTLYYRIAALRSIRNEKDLPEDILSQATAPLAVRLIDTNIPASPSLGYQNGVLSWHGTVSQGTYYILKQNSRGNWQTIGQPVNGELNEAIDYVLPALSFNDTNGDPLYHRFRVDVQNSSGIMNLDRNEITISNLSDH